MQRETLYSSGSLLQRELGLAVGWVDHRGSVADPNPIWNGRRDIGLIFSGEHFSDAAGVDVRSLLRLYEEREAAFFDTLNGIFSGLLIDRRQSKVVLFNDRYGLGRVYFHEGPDGFYFSSEAKSLLRVLPHLRQPDVASLGEFFSCGCALQNRTLFAGISILPGAAAWTFTPHREIKKGAYFDRTAWENQGPISADDYYERLNETFTRILARYLRGTQPIGLSLTGGLDSRMIISGAVVKEGMLRCHTFGGMYRECADVRLAKQIAAACHQPHEVISLTEDFFKDFPRLAERSVSVTDGAMDVTGAVELFMNSQVRQRTPIRLTGNYGSEVLRSNVALRLGKPDHTLFDPGFTRHLAEARETYAQERAGPVLPFIVFKQVPWHHYGRLAVEQSQLTVRSPFLDNELVALAFRAPPDPVLTRVMAHRFIGDHNPALAAIPTDRGVVGRDGASRGRLAHFRQEFLPRMEYLFDYGMPAWLTRLNHILEPLGVEQWFLGRQKFYHFRAWYHRQLAGYVQDALLDKRALSRSYLNRRRVECVVQEHVTGVNNHTLSIHKLITAELLHSRLLKQC